MNVFDIETGPLPWHLIEKTLPPFDEEKAVPHPGDFDESSVKLGRLSDPVKIKAKMDAARDQHAEAVKGLARLRADARNKWQADAMGKAALSALTGTIKAIGYWNTAGDVKQIVAVDALGGVELEIVEINTLYMTFTTEKDLLKWTWEKWKAEHGLWVGHNIHGFDLPFLMRRSWMNGIQVPGDVMTGRYFSPQLVDTMAKWNCGGREFVKLAAISKFFGGQDKPDDCTGADFARLFDNGGNDRMAAIKYLIGDLEMTAYVAESMGII